MVETHKCNQVNHCNTTHNRSIIHPSVSMRLDEREIEVESKSKKRCHEKRVSHVVERIVHLDGSGSSAEIVKF